MATTVGVYFASILSGSVKVVNADGTALKTILTAGASGGKVEQLTVSADEAKTVQLWKTSGGVDYLLATVSIPANAGAVAGTPPIDLLDRAYIPTLTDEHALILGANEILKIAATVAVTAGKTVYVQGAGGNC